MKVILLGDTHLDDRNGDAKLLETQMTFLKRQLIPYAVENGIKEIYQLGDITNNRTHLCLNTQHEMLVLFDLIQKRGLKINYLLGNHDIFYKDNRSVYSMEVFARAFECLRVIDTPMMIDNIQIVPWLCKDEKLEVNPAAKVILGHFEMKDFYVTRAYKSEHGLSAADFKSIQMYSGHYHIKQDVGNIHYVGTPYQLDWNDFNTLKGFHVLDTETLECEFIENTTTPKHIKLFLDVETKKIQVEGHLATIYTADCDAFCKGLTVGVHKFKVYAKKELAITKKLIETIEKAGHSVKLEITPEEEDVNVEERIEKVKALSIADNILAIVDDDDRALTFDILTIAKSAMLQDKKE